MILANETKQKVAYWINAGGGSPECGNIDVDGIVDLPKFDQQTNVYVGFKPAGGAPAFAIICATTGSGEQVEMSLVVAGGK
jgi:hypothetical protein